MREGDDDAKSDVGKPVLIYPKQRKRDNNGSRPESKTEDQMPPDKEDVAPKLGAAAAGKKAVPKNAGSDDEDTESETAKPNRPLSPGTIVHNKKVETTLCDRMLHHREHDGTLKLYKRIVEMRDVNDIADAVEELRQPRHKLLDALDLQGLTLLHYAAAVSHKGAVSVLLGANANPNVLDIMYNSSLHVACFYDRGPIVRSLILSRADVEKRNGQHRLCYEIENEEGFPQPLRVLASQPYLKSTVNILAAVNTAETNNRGTDNIPNSPTNRATGVLSRRLPRNAGFLESKEFGKVSGKGRDHNAVKELVIQCEREQTR